MFYFFKSSATHSTHSSMLSVNFLVIGSAMITSETTPRPLEKSILLHFCLHSFKQLLKLLAEPMRGIVNDLMSIALTDMQRNDLTIIGITVNKSDVVEKVEMLLHVLQAFVEVEADNVICYVVATRLHSVDDTAHTFILGVKAEVDEGDFETGSAEVVYHSQHHVG